MEAEFCAPSLAVAQDLSVTRNVVVAEKLNHATASLDKGFDHVKNERAVEKWNQ